MLEHLGSPFCLVAKAFACQHDVAPRRRRDVIATHSALAYLTGAIRKALAAYLLAPDRVGCARLLIRDGVAAEFNDAHQRLDGACFVDCLFHVRDCR